MPRYFSAVAACSRELPEPKLKPPTRMSPSLSELLELGIVVFHGDGGLLRGRHVVDVGVLAGIDAVGVQIVLMAEKQFAFEHRGEPGQDGHRAALLGLRLADAGRADGFARR